MSFFYIPAFFVFVDALNEFLRERRWNYPLRRAMRTYLGFAVAFPCFVFVVNFCAAIPPQADARIPVEWSGGVMNHGKFHEWYTIRDRPYLFALSVVGFVTAGAFLIRQRLQIERERKQKDLEAK